MYLCCVSQIIIPKREKRFEEQNRHRKQVNFNMLEAIEEESEYISDQMSQEALYLRGQEQRKAEVV